MKLLDHIVNSIFNFFEELPTVLQGSCIISHSHWQCSRVSISQRPHQHLLLSFFLFIINLVVVKWYIAIALICIFLMTNDEHLSHMHIGYLYNFFGELSIQIFCSFINFFCLFIIEP